MHGRAARWFDLATLALVVAVLFRLVRMASGAVFGADECFHATVARWIADHGRLPRELPEFYSGFYYFYPPLFHLLGAAWVRAFGAEQLRFMNVAVYGATLVAAWWAARSERWPDASRYAVCLVLTCTPLADYAVRLYAEALTTLLCVVAYGALAHLLDSGRGRYAVVLGAVLGALLVTKLSALALPPVLWVTALVLASRRPDTARQILGATGLAIAIALPFWVRNAMLFGAPLYPAGAPDADPMLARLQAHHFAFGASRMLWRTATAIGPAIGIGIAFLLFGAWRHKKSTLPKWTLAVAAAFFLVALFEPLAAARHLNPVIAVIAVAAAVGAATELAATPHRIAVASVGLLIAAAMFALGLPNPRPGFDARSDVVDAGAAIRRAVPQDERVLSLWTYDTAYYSGRAATWPIPYGQRDRPLEMFVQHDCDSVAAAFERHAIRYALVPLVPRLDAVFDGSNYPAGLMNCLAALRNQGRAHPVWQSKDWMLLRVGE